MKKEIIVFIVVAIVLFFMHSSFLLVIDDSYVKGQAITLSDFQAHSFNALIFTTISMIGSSFIWYKSKKSQVHS